MRTRTLQHPFTKRKTMSNDHREGCRAVPFLQQFEREEMTVCDPDPDRPGHCRVPKKHPVAWVFDATALKQGKPVLGKSDEIPGTGCYSMTTERVEACRLIIKDLLDSCTCFSASAPKDEDDGDEDVSALSAALTAVSVQEHDTPYQQTMNLMARVRKCLTPLARALTRLRNNDFKAPSVTESGFKTAFLTALAACDPDLEFHSEVEVGMFFADVVVVDTKTRCAVVYELKYVSCCFLRAVRYMPTDPFRESYRKANSLAAQLMTQDTAGVLQHLYRDPASGRFVPVNTLTTSATKQAKSYADMIMAGKKCFLTTGDRSLVHVEPATLIGVGSRVFENP